MILNDEEILKTAREEVCPIVDTMGIKICEAIAEAQNKKTLLDISKEAKRMDGSIYLVPDYEKFREAIKEIEGGRDGI